MYGVRLIYTNKRYPMTNYGTDILAERARYRLGQGEVGSRVGVSVQTIIDIENNRIGIDKETHERFLDAIRAPAANDSTEAAA